MCPMQFRFLVAVLSGFGIFAEETWSAFAMAGFVRSLASERRLLLQWFGRLDEGHDAASIVSHGHVSSIGLVASF